MQAGTEVKFKVGDKAVYPAQGVAEVIKIAEGVKSERLQILQELIEEQQRRFNESCAGRLLPVLFEKLGLMSRLRHDPVRMADRVLDTALLEIAAE